MPRGRTTIDIDGTPTEVATSSAEYRAYVAANPDQRKRYKPKEEIPSMEIPTIEQKAPHEHIRRGPPPPKKSSAPTKTEREDEVKDLAALVIMFYGAIAAITMFPAWELNADEAQAIARPARKIIARNKHIERAIAQYMDPIALIAAVAIPTAGRASLYFAHLADKKRQNVTPPKADTTARTPGVPPPPPGPYADPTMNEMVRISQGIY